MKFPIVKVTKPSNLTRVSNGELPSGLLRPVGPGGLLHSNAARAFEAMRVEALLAGFALTYTWGGTYRTLEAQKSLFLRRYDPEFVEGRNVLENSRTYNGTKWYKRAGVAAAASPGTSNHGLGLAIDLALDKDPTDGLDPDDAVSIGPALNWLWLNAERFGFSWELQSEPWHVRFVCGDEIPDAVRAFERTSPAPPPPPADPTSPTRPTLRLGSVGPDVEHLQRALKARGFTITIDGHFGPQTDRTVRAFQSRVRIAVDGVVGPVTWEKIETSTPPRAKRPTIRIGSSGDDVRFLQRVLVADGHALVVDGRFGPTTDRKVRDFQRKHRLKIDGIVGPVTWQTVNSIADLHEVVA